MVTLKLKGPKRPEANPPKQLVMEVAREGRGVRKSGARCPSWKSTDKSGLAVSTLDAQSGSVPLQQDAVSPPGDTIRVHDPRALRVRSTSADIDPLDLHEKGESSAAEQTDDLSELQREPGHNSTEQRLPAKTVHNPVKSTEVVEYDFGDEPDLAEDFDDGRDTMWYKKSRKHIDSVVVISSDDDKADQSSEWNLNDRPWRDFNVPKRSQWEQMYCHVTDYAMNGDWETTEAYQDEKDKEMIRYIDDFPLREWVLPQEIVAQAYDRLVERTRWRAMGMRLFGDPRLTRVGKGASSISPNEPQQAGLAMLSNSSQYAIPYSRSAQYHPSHLSYHQQQLPGPRASSSQHRPYTHTQMPGPHSEMMRRNTVSNSANILRNVGMQMAPDAYLSPTGDSYLQPVKRHATERQVLPGPPPPTPPYEKREKPTHHKPAPRRKSKRGVEADEFPWNRHINFMTARANAVWDDGIYDHATLESMSATRKRNENVLTRIDAAEIERARITREAKKHAKLGANSDTEVAKPTRRRKSAAGPSFSKGGTTDLYHSGQFMFMPENQEKVLALGDKTPDEVITAAEAGEISMEDCAELMICWNPGQKTTSQDLEQARFSIKDTILTRQQLAMTPVLVQRAAECLVDFCPDILWRSMLLRITSEAGYGNKAVRDRMCLNGNYCDKATITKRIGAALGLKQQPPANQRKKANERERATSAAAEGEDGEELSRPKKSDDEYYHENVADFGNYMEFFGHRTSHRSQLHIAQARAKRDAKMMSSDDAEIESQLGSSQKHAEQSSKTLQSPEAMDVSDSNATSAAGDHADESEDEAWDDAVSVQSDTMLDQMSEG